MFRDGKATLAALRFFRCRVNLARAADDTYFEGVHDL